jgi:uncharacterized protein YdhG (YjbR/CyaY superfamily)
VGIVVGYYETMKTIDEYIGMQSPKIRETLEKIRNVIQKEAPDAIETISYQMPTFKLSGKNLVHFAAWKNHIGFYPTPSGLEEFKEELSKYNGAKGSVQFPLNQPMPLDLIRKIVRFRMQENLLTK